jgi:NADH-quinone oxidoreductase subunit B
MLPRCHYVIGVNPMTLEMPDHGRLRVLDAGLACCALEYSAATLVQKAWDQLDAEPVSGGAYDVLVVAGTVTTALLPVVRAAYDGLGPRRVVISFGACSTSGGPYWDSYAVVPGLEAGQIPVDIHVPGCPPPPSAVIEALRAARSLVSERAGT